MLKALNCLSVWRDVSRNVHIEEILEVRRLLGAEWRLEDSMKQSCADKSFRIARFLHLPTRIDFCLIPGGHFFDGSHTSEVKPFLMATFPFTNLDLGNNYWSEKAMKGRELYRPVYDLGFEAFNEIVEEHGFSTPYYFQWQWAMRGGADTRFYWGDEFDPARLFCAGGPKNYLKGRHAIKTESHKNAFGLQDMLGNCFEWCKDHKGNPMAFGGDFKSPEEFFTDEQNTLFRMGSKPSRFVTMRPVKLIPREVPSNSDKQIFLF